MVAGVPVKSRVNAPRDGLPGEGDRVVWSLARSLDTLLPLLLPTTDLISILETNRFGALA